jgi:hypothetical protein
MISQFYYGGVDNNPLTLMYSAYMGMWSTLFLSTWKRRENELKFLWGTNALHNADIVREQFKGVIHINLETGRQKYVIANAWAHTGRQLLGFLVVFLMIAITVTSATLAMLLRYMGDTDVKEVEECQAEAIRGVVASVQDEARECMRDLTETTETEMLELDSCSIGDETAFLHSAAYDVMNRTRVHILGLAGKIKMPDKATADAGSWSGSESWQDDAEEAGADAFADFYAAFYAQRFTIASSVANLLIIVIYGNIFELVAIKLNNFENYRTDADYSDGIILKNFVFQCPRPPGAVERP